LWNFGDTFYFSELSAYLHDKMSNYVSAIVLVPNDSSQSFGKLYEIHSAPHEIFVNAAQISDIVVVGSLNTSELNNI
jgi:hypothetical protein